nr:hypothetical protein [Tanacetum cinerariifolium]
PTAKGIGLRVVYSHIGNHPEDGFTPLETIQRLLVVIRRRSHSGFKEEAFELERRVHYQAPQSNVMYTSMLNSKSFKDKLPLNIDENPYFQRLGRYPTSVYVFDDPVLFLAGLKPSWEFSQQRLVIIMSEMAIRNFIYTEDDDHLAFLPKEPSPGFGSGSPSASVNTKLPKDVEEPEVQPAEITADSRESKSRPPVKRKLAAGSSSSRVVRAKTSISKDDAPILSISDEDEGKFLVHLVLSEGHLDNQMDLKLLDLHDRCYARHAMVDNAVNKRAREFLLVIKKMRGEADVIKAKETSCKEECEELRVKCEAAMAEFDLNPCRIL